MNNGFKVSFTLDLLIAYNSKTAFNPVEVYFFKLKIHVMAKMKKLAVLFGALVLNIALAAPLPNNAILMQAKNGDVAALQVLESYVLENTSNSDYTEILKVLNVASAKKSAIAKRILATMYTKGSGVEKNLAKAFSLYVDAAKKGDTKAQISLAHAYYNGNGTDVNIISSYIWANLSLKYDAQPETRAFIQKVQQQLNSAQIEKAQEIVRQIDEIYL